MSVGDSNDPEVLHRIGALEANSVVVQHEYWRFITALFLHGGLLHLGFNVFALYVLGPPLERSIGTMRFVGCYLISGIASGAGVVGLTLVALTRPAQLVGASGSIMGIVGAWGGFLMRHRHAPYARQRLANVAVIVAIQIAFDLSTPQVSMAAHLCGLIAGFFLGLILAPRPVAGAVTPAKSKIFAGTPMRACSFRRLTDTPVQLQRIARTEKFAMTRASSPAREARALPRNLPDQVFLVNCGSVLLPC